MCPHCTKIGKHDEQMTIMGSGGAASAKYWQCQMNEFHREPFGITVRKRDENEVFDSERDKAIPDLP